MRLEVTNVDINPEVGDENDKTSTLRLNVNSEIWDKKDRHQI